MIRVDGSLGEGGGQVLRTSLSLSALIGEELRIVNIRANRSNPGLSHQHLQAVRAAAEICSARVEGDQLRSQELTFVPQRVKSGRYHFSIPTAGSAPLVLQTIFYPLAMAEGESRITVQGGTHVRWSPCYHYLAWQWLPFMKQIGYEADLTLEKAGYYPKGGGEIDARIGSSAGRQPAKLEERGSLKHIRGLSALTDLPDHITRRMRDRVVSRLGKSHPLQDLKVKHIPGHGKGAFILLLARFETSQACYFSLGERGKRAEVVADEAVDQMLEFLHTDGCVDKYLADQLLVPLALAEGPSRIRVPVITSHLVTNAEIIQKFLPVHITFSADIGAPGIVEVEP